MIRPESGATLEQIATMLQEHPDLRLLIEIYGIDGPRMETAGFGESQPVASNDTAEGKEFPTD